MVVPHTSVEQQPREVTDLVTRFYAAFSAGDLGTISDLVSRQGGVILIGTDPKEWYTTYDEIIQVLRAQLNEMGGSVPVTPGDVAAYRYGDVGWAADQPTFKLPDGNELGVRISLVAHREGSTWKIVHAHISLGVSNEEALSKELTT
jgi:hypothetical protein